MATAPHLPSDVRVAMFQAMHASKAGGNEKKGLAFDSTCGGCGNKRTTISDTIQFHCSKYEVCRVVVMTMKNQSGRLGVL